MSCSILAHMLVIAFPASLTKNEKNLLVAKWNCSDALNVIFVNNYSKPGNTDFSRGVILC